jgi:transposase
VLAEPNSAIPELVRPTMKPLVEEIRLLEARVGQLERELTQTARASAACTTLLSIPGVGLLTATAMVAATSGNVSHFRDARHFAAWFGLTPKEHSSGSTRRIGRISKRGDRCLRMLLTHGARSVLRAAGPPSTACAPGRSPCRGEPITTRRPARSPTSSHASATRACATARPTVRSNG